VLILETARGGLSVYGPGFRECHVGIVTNLFEDHLGFQGIHTVEQMAEVKAAVPRAVRKDGAVVLNGDDPLVGAMAAKSAAEPVYFVMGDNYDRFDKVFFLRDDSIWRKSGADEKPVIPVTEIPIASRGLQPYNVANAMTALATVEGMNRFLPIDGAVVGTALREFGSDPHDNLGRFHRVTLEGERFLIFYAKNPESFRLEVDVVETIRRREGFEHVVGAITAPGNRVPAYYRDISKAVAPVCDLVFVRGPEEKYLRGRHPQEIVRLLSSSVPSEKLIEDKGFSASELIGLSRQRLAGKILFVFFTALFDAGVDVGRILDQAEGSHPLAGP
jgi:cyanophycin synthetase